MKITAGAVNNYVYRLKYGRAETVAMAIMALYSGNPFALMSARRDGRHGRGHGVWRDGGMGMGGWLWRRYGVAGGGMGYGGGMGLRRRYAATAVWGGAVSAAAMAAMT